MKDRKRKQFDFKPAQEAELSEVEDLLGCTTAAEAVRRSVKIARQLLILLKSGGKLYVEHPDGTKERIMLL